MGNRGSSIRLYLLVSEVKCGDHPLEGIPCMRIKFFYLQQNIFADICKNTLGILKFSDNSRKIIFSWQLVTLQSALECKIV